jgi:ribonuclease HI
MIITNDWLVKNKTPNGGYNKKQFNILGISYPPKKGWKEQVVGMDLSEDKVNEFEQISNPNNGQNKNTSISIPIAIAIQETKNPKKINISDLHNYDIDYFVYTDGSCINNGTRNAIAGMGIYFGENDPRNVSKQVIGKQSNNIAELQAIIDVYDIVKDDIMINKKICIVSDSSYSLHCLTSYGEEQEKTGWSKNIPNKELVQHGYNLYKKEENVYFMYIKAHTLQNDIHSIGNEGADQLANQAIGMSECPYGGRNKIYLNVPFVQKEEVKKLGGKWDKDAKKWYITENDIHRIEVLDLFFRA